MKAQQHDDTTDQAAYDEGTQPRRDDGRRRRGGPVADPDVEARMNLLAEALRGVADDTSQGEVNWSGIDELDLGYRSIVKALESSVPPNRPTDGVPDGYWTTQQGS